MRYEPLKDSDWVNQTAATIARPKLSEVLFRARERSFASMVPLPSSVEAIESALLYATGVHSFLAIVGPSGWGKTHLLSAICGFISREETYTLDRITVLEYLANPGKGEAPHLILDDVQTVLGQPRQRHELQLRLNMRVRRRKPTVLSFTAGKPCRQIRAMLPFQKEWTVAAIGDPALDERVLFISQMARQEGLMLSSHLSKILAAQMYGDGRTFVGALKRLRTLGLEWIEPSDVLRAVGVLDPFFRDNPAWDLERLMLNVAEGSRLPLTGGMLRDLTLYAMSRKAEISEADIARAAEVSRAEVYRSANRFESELARSELLAASLRLYVEHVVASLLE